MGNEVMETENNEVKADYYSDNSASLPGISGTGGPVGFEPGMFSKQDLSKVIDSMLFKADLQIDSKICHQEKRKYKK